MSKEGVIASLHHTIKSHTSDVNGVCFSKDKKLATCSGDKTVRVWETLNYSEYFASPLCGHSYYVHCCTFSPFGSYLATCSTDGKVIVWDIKTGNKHAVFQHESQASIRVCRFSPNSAHIISGGDDHNLCLWDVTAKILIRTYRGHEATVFGCDFSPDGQHIVSGSSDGDLQIWDAVYGHAKALWFMLDAHDLGVTWCEFSPTFGTDSTSSSAKRFLLATAGNDDVVKLWDFMSISGSAKVSLTLRQTLAGHTGSVAQCRFSLNGKLLASGSIDKTVRLWDPLQASLLHVIEGHSRYVTSCAFSSDGHYLATGSNDKTVMVWKLTPEREFLKDVANNKVCEYFEAASNQNGAEEVKQRVKKIEEWTEDDVAQWVYEIGLDQYSQAFKQQHIDGTELFTLTHDSLMKSLGVEALGHQNKILRLRTKLLEHPVIQQKDLLDQGIPDEYLCPITHELMKDPVICSDGYTYERAAIASWIESGKACSPMTNAVLANKDLTPNRSLKMLIQRYLNPT